MAISEVCKYQVKKEIDECVSKGMSRNKAAKWLAGVLTDESGHEIKPETIRQKDYRVRQELATNVTTQGWPKCKQCGLKPVFQNLLSGNPDDSGLCFSCKAKQEYDARPECKNESLGRCKHHAKVANGPHGKTAKHGLCKGCRQAELMDEQIWKSKQKGAKAQKEFDQTLIDPESDQFWNKLCDKLSDVECPSKDIPTGRVSEEVLKKIDLVKRLLIEIYEVEKNSTRPSEYT